MPSPVRVDPDDPFNRELVGQVHPPEWRNPVPKGRYHLVILGAGTAGLVTAAGAAALGAKVALIEKDLLGGDCLNVGCVPSKTLIRSGRAAMEVLSAAKFGIRVPAGAAADFPAVMERVRRLRARLGAHDSAERFRGLGVDVYLGEGSFTGPDAVEVAGQTLRFKRAVIATGARAAVPPIPGLAENGFLTNETVFTLTTLPRRLAVIGGGPLGCELAQAFCRLGSQVTVLHAGPHLLEREDEDAAEIVQRAFLREGIRLFCNVNIGRVEKDGDGRAVHFRSPGQEHKLVVDEILVGAGRTPNVDRLGLQRSGVQYDSLRGVKVDDRLRTSNPRIFAAGDVCSVWKFTHAADAAARIVIQNALFLGRKRFSALTLPWCTYTDPEIAHVGWYARDAAARGLAVQTYVRELEKVDRAVADGQEEGFVKILVKKGTDRILGATIVASHAGDLISEISVAMGAGMGLKGLFSVVHPYPTQAEALPQAAGAYLRSRLTRGVKALLAAWLAWTR